MDQQTAQSNTQNQIVAKLKAKLDTSNLPLEITEKVQSDLAKLEVLFKTSTASAEAESIINYLNFLAEYPWKKESVDILDLKRATQVLNKNHHGMEVIKDRILEYLSVLILNKQKDQKAHQPVLAFVGLVGSGKTSLAYSIAESLGRPIIRIPFGGLGSALQLRGESRVKAEAEPGLIAKALKKAQVKNPVILLDELDRVALEAKNDIMGVLVELLDPNQNYAFLDHYVGFPIDLSEVLFITTANNTANIATAVLDRLELIEMPFYTDEQKVVIGRDFLLPEALKLAGLEPNILNIDPLVWDNIVRPLGFDGGIRSLKRNIDMMVRKIARKVVEGETGPYQINATNIAEFLPK